MHCIWIQCAINGAAAGKPQLLNCCRAPMERALLMEGCQSSGEVGRGGRRPRGGGGGGGG